MRSAWDLLYDLPYESAKRVDENALWLQDELWKLSCGRGTCKTNHLSLFGFHYSREDRKIVSRKSAGKNGSGLGSAEGGTIRDELRFVNVHVPESAVSEVEEYLTDLPSLCVGIVSLTAIGGDVLIKRKRGSDDWLCMVTFDDAHVSGGRVALTAWGAVPADAVASFMYKWEHLLGEQMPAPTNEDVSGRKRFG